MHSLWAQEAHNKALHLNATQFSGVAAVNSVVERQEAWRFLQGESPCWVRSNQPPIPSVAVVEEVKEPNKTAEAYTGNHIGRKGDRNP